MLIKQETKNCTHKKKKNYKALDVSLLNLAYLCHNALGPQNLPHSDLEDTVRVQVTLTSETFRNYSIRVEQECVRRIVDSKYVIFCLAIAKFVVRVDKFGISASESFTLLRKI